MTTEVHPGLTFVPPEREAEKLAPAPAYLDIRPDYQATFKAFCEQHGNNPIVHRGVLLFADGYRYSRTDYRGPEFPPPDNPAERTELLRTYWTERQRIVTHRVRLLQERRETMLRDIRARSAPFVGIIRYMARDEAGNRKLVVERGPLDPSIFDGELAWLAADLAECRNRLQELSDGNATTW